MEFPPQIERHIQGATIRKNTTSESGDQVFHINDSHFLKVAAGPRAEELSQEHATLRWLKGKIRSPEVVEFTVARDASYLLTAALEGSDASDWRQTGMSERELMAELASLLKQVHQIPAQNCPYRWPSPLLVADAEMRVETGQVREDEFDAPRMGLSAAEVFKQLLALPPFEDDPVFGHGDFCLPNIIFSEKSGPGILDVGRAGLTDRYRDIALLFRSFERNTDTQLPEIFLECYGLVDEINWDKIRFFEILDEFF